MVTYVKAHSEKFVDNSKIRAARKKMRQLLDTMDSMNEPTFGAFDDNCAGDVYTVVADSIVTLSNITSLR